MLVTFEYWVSFGKGDYGESYIEMEITEEECERLRKAEEVCEDFYKCEMVADIYERAYELADREATANLQADGILAKDKRASEVYPIEVCYPGI